MKKLICSLLTLSLALLVLTTSYAQEDTDIETLRAADVNADGMINILDLVLVASHFGEIPTEDQTPNPDVNGDGNINILDLVLVANHLGETVPTDFKAEKIAIQEVYSAFYKAFNDNDIDAIAQTFDTESITFGANFSRNEPVPVFKGWINEKSIGVKDVIFGMWVGIGTKGAKWGPNDILSHFWIRHNEASAVGLNCFKGPYLGETQLYLVKKEGQWLIQQLDTITENKTDTHTWTDKGSWRLDKFFTDEADKAP